MRAVAGGPFVVFALIAATIAMAPAGGAGPPGGTGPIATLGARPALAGTEEFSTFDVEAQEEDDESLLDHYLTRSPRAWRDEWERAPQAIRTSQGCLTSGQWFIDTDLKLRSPLGRRARFGLDLRQSESDAESFEYLDFSFQFPTRFGTPGAMFRPLYDKSRQDFALTWQAGSDSSALQVQAAFTFEDLFNNLWAFRQSRVGQEYEPYERHPWEPGLHVATRHERWRAELGGRYLTPSRKRIVNYGSGSPPRIATLWGTLGYASLELRTLGIDWEARGANHQALSTDRSSDDSDGRHHEFRRSWLGEVAARRSLFPWLTLETRWLYQERGQHYGPPLGPSMFQAEDRMLAFESTIRLNPRMSLRAGALHDRITIAKVGQTPDFSYGTRVESRTYVGLLARFGRVSVSGIEGIELDPEPYEVPFGLHDKGFLHLQTTF